MLASSRPHSKDIQKWKIIFNATCYKAIQADVFIHHIYIRVLSLAVYSRAGNLLIRSSLIGSFCSNQMSDCEQFAQIVQDK